VQHSRPIILTEPHRQMVDASCGGTLMLKSENEAWNLFKNLSKNSIRMPTLKSPKTEGLFEVSNQVDVTTKVDHYLER
jgi:hypothetical protein